MQVSTLRPGLLVSLKTAIKGNVSYVKTEIEAEHVLDNGTTSRAKWETIKTVIDADEQERAKVARGRCRSVVTAICAQSDFGLLCPESKAQDLESAIAESRRVAEEFNATAQHCEISVYVISGRVEQNDREAIRAINSEVRGLLADMEKGIETLDAEAVRAAANKAKNLASMLTAEASDRIKEAIAAVRSEARKMVKAGEAAAIEIDQHTLSALARARTQFLDLEGSDVVAAPEAEARAADLTPEDEAAADFGSAPTRAADLQPGDEGFAEAWINGTAKPAAPAIDLD